MLKAKIRNVAVSFRPTEKPDGQTYKNLVRFSLGQASATKTLERLGLDNAEDLFLMMAQAHLPMPHLSETTTQVMVQSLHQWMTENRSAKQSKCQVNGA